MGSLVVVAIPAEDDYVWKISSEKVPHCTILFLGEADGQPVTKITEFVEHAVNFYDRGPFFLDVDYRGKLGEDEADVLFFRRNWAVKELDDFRSQLLKNNNIRTAYDSTEQFPVWTPHLTLGYPETPAKPDNRDYPGISYVRFDRIAVWTGNYEGPEFRLNYSYDSLEEVMMSDQATAGREFLSHYGVKGMRWGVRKDRSPSEVAVKETLSVRGQTKIKTQGGAAHRAAPEALKAAEQRAKLKRSGAAALSNRELKELNERMRLEVEAKRLDKENVSSGKKFVKGLVKNEGRQEGSRIIRETIREQTSKK